MSKAGRSLESISGLCSPTTDTVAVPGQVQSLHQLVVITIREDLENSLSIDRVHNFMGKDVLEFRKEMADRGERVKQGGDRKSRLPEETVKLKDLNVSKKQSHEVKYEKHNRIHRG